MSAPPPRYRRPAASFSPRFTLSLIYLFGFFFLYCLVLVAPALYEVGKTLPPGPEQEEAARLAAKTAVQPRLWIPIAASVFTVAVGAWFQVLPGMRPRN